MYAIVQVLLAKVYNIRERDCHECGTEGTSLLLSQCTFHDNIQEAKITDADTIDFEENL